VKQRGAAPIVEVVGNQDDAPPRRREARQTETTIRDDGQQLDEAAAAAAPISSKPSGADVQVRDRGLLSALSFEGETCGGAPFPVARRSSVGIATSFYSVRARESGDAIGRWSGLARGHPASRVQPGSVRSSS